MRGAQEINREKDDQVAPLGAIVFRIRDARINRHMRLPGVLFCSLSGDFQDG